MFDSDGERSKLDAKPRKTPADKSRIITLNNKIKKLEGVIFEIRKELKKYGSGYIGHGYNICPDSVSNDVSRLEVLIGGKRAGNNSREIINEAAGICQGLFKKMTDVHIYRELIDKLIDSD